MLTCRSMICQRRARAIGSLSLRCTASSKNPTASCGNRRRHLSFSFVARFERIVIERRADDRLLPGLTVRINHDARRPMFGQMCIHIGRGNHRHAPREFHQRDIRTCSPFAIVKHVRGKRRAGQLVSRYWTSRLSRSSSSTGRFRSAAFMAGTKTSMVLIPAGSRPLDKSP